VRKHNATKYQAPAARHNYDAPPSDEKSQQFPIDFLHHLAIYDTVYSIREMFPMNAKDFRRIALSLEGAEEGSHMGAVDFRVGGRIFATLASIKQGYGNLMLNPEQQTAFIEELPELFLPVAGGWGRMGATHIRLAAANEDVLRGALQTAWKLRLEKNADSRHKTRTPSKRQPAPKPRTKER
jgi:hypothetical protein